MTRTHLPTTSRSISVDRRTILRSTVAGAALATVATVASPALNVLAQDASPVSLPDGGATPVGVPAALHYAYVGADSRTAIANGARTPDMGPASDGKATTRHVVDAVIEALNAG